MLYACGEMLEWKLANVHLHPRRYAKIFIKRPSSHRALVC